MKKSSSRKRELRRQNARQHRWALESIIGTVAGATVLYLMGVLFKVPGTLIFSAMLCLMFAIAWMAIKILKDAWSTQKTFDEFFYEDRGDLRRTRLIRSPIARD